jgi:hypothetical protein
MTIRTYSSPAAFKQALEQRLRTPAKTGAEFARKRQLLVFDRFLARIVAVLGDAATLKGGLVLELRLERARTTKDVDLRMTSTPNERRQPRQQLGPLSESRSPQRKSGPVLGRGPPAGPPTPRLCGLQSHFSSFAARAHFRHTYLGSLTMVRSSANRAAIVSFFQSQSWITLPM